MYCDRIKLLGSITINKDYATCLNFPNYLFYKDGKVFNIKKKRFIKKSLTINKYEFLVLHNNKNKMFFYVHRLIYLLFKDNIPDNYEIDHINHIRDDNNLENLRCISKTENRQNRRTQNNNYSECDKKHNDKYKKYYHDYYFNKKNNI